jgi:hypothetical protein
VKLVNARIVQGPHYPRLYYSLQALYEVSACNIKSGEGKMGVNGFTTHALAAFILTVSVWESLLDWSFFSVWTRIYFGDVAADRCSKSRKRTKGLSILEKTYEIPLIAFDRSFDKTKSPYFELETLVRIRNHIVHEQQGRVPENEIDVLRESGCLLWEGKPPIHPLDERSWQQDICTLESIRWCLNLLPNIVAELANLSGHEGTHHLKTFAPLDLDGAKRIIGTPFQGKPFTVRT